MKGKAEISETRISRLLDAAIDGDLQSLRKLLQEDRLILDRCIVAQSGHFTQSPLHIAAEKGYLGIVQALLEVNPNLIFARDQDGRNPVHVAAINGHLHVLNELIQAKPQAVGERTNGGETALHLCVKHNQQEALKFLANLIDDGELLSSKDGDGNTVLHVAVATKQLEIVKFLLNNKRMKKNAINTNGSTAMDVLVKSREGENDKDIRQALKSAKVLPAKDALKRYHENQVNLHNHRDALMVVASLIATMAFQVGTHPPGGTWQDNNDGHTAGHSIMADMDIEAYNRLVIYSSAGLASSLTVILLLISGLTCKRFFMGLLMFIMWISVTATALNFHVSIFFFSTHNMNPAIKLPASISLLWLVFLLPLLILCHIILYTVKCLKNCCN